MRYYKAKYPELGDIVYGHVYKIDKTHIIVQIPEYDDIEAMIIIADATIRKKGKPLCLMRINKKYPIAIKQLSDDGTQINCTFKYVSYNLKKKFKEGFQKYEKMIRLFQVFLKKAIKDFGYEEEYSDDYFHDRAETSLWRIDKDKLYDYILDFYLGKNNLDDFDMTDDEKVLFKSIIEKSFGKLKINTTYRFSLRNSSFGGVNDIVNMFDTIKDKYGVDVYVSIPEYIVTVSSDNEVANTDLVLSIENDITNMCKKSKLAYKKIDISTTNNL